MKNCCFKALIVSFTCASIYAQGLPQPETSSGFWWYLIVFLLLFGAIGSIIWAISLKRSVRKSEFQPKVSPTKITSEQVSTGTKRTSSSQETSQGRTPIKPIVKETKIDSTLLLPVFLAKSLPIPQPYTPLPVSNDEGLLSAIEEIEAEESDEEIKMLSLKVLAAFRTKNSVDALSKLVQNDPSEEIRVKALQILADFNHESVFEPILLASADPSKRVRTAAAQALSRLTIDRASAWMRITESNDPEKMLLCARAAIDSEFAERIFNRLLSKDFNQANEAMAVIALLIKSGETTIIFRKLAEEQNQALQRAILRVIKLTRSEKALGGLYLMLEKENLSEDIKREIDEVIEEIGAGSSGSVSD